jgi:transposase-like protein
MRNADLICKLCGSNKLTKYGRHPGGQRYLCDNCGHTFTDNKSLPGMRVNKAIIDRFVELRSQSKTFSQIIDIVQAEFGINLSKGTLWKWQRKFLLMPTIKDKHWRCSMVELTDIALQNRGKSVSPVKIRSIFGYSQSTKIEDTQLFTTGIILKKGKGWLIKSYCNSLSSRGN